MDRAAWQTTVHRVADDMTEATQQQQQQQDVNRDITLPTKFCLVKAVVFPVVMYGCESWTIKKAEH